MFYDKCKLQLLFLIEFPKLMMREAIGKKKKRNERMPREFLCGREWKNILRSNGPKARSYKKIKKENNNNSNSFHVEQMEARMLKREQMISRRCSDASCTWK